MQEEILKTLNKLKKIHKYDWILQSELRNYVKQFYNFSCEAAISKALCSMRKYNEVTFKPIANCNDLKKIHRFNGVISVRHITFAYKIQ